MSTGYRLTGLVVMDFRFLAALGITMALRKATQGDKYGLAPRTGNHKGCPYDGFDGACFHSNDRKAGAGS